MGNSLWLYFQTVTIFLLSKNTLNLSLYILLTEYPIKPYFRYIFYSTICFIPNILGEIQKNQLSTEYPLCNFHIEYQHLSCYLDCELFSLGTVCICSQWRRLNHAEAPAWHSLHWLMPCLSITHSQVSDSEVLACNPRTPALMS